MGSFDANKIPPRQPVGGGEAVIGLALLLFLFMGVLFRLFEYLFL